MRTNHRGTKYRRATYKPKGERENSGEQGVRPSTLVSDPGLAVALSWNWLTLYRAERPPWKHLPLAEEEAAVSSASVWRIETHTDSTTRC